MAGRRFGFGLVIGEPDGVMYTEMVVRLDAVYDWLVCLDECTLLEDASDPADDDEDEDLADSADALEEARESEELAELLEAADVLDLVELSDFVDLSLALDSSDLSLALDSSDLSLALDSSDEEDSESPDGIVGPGRFVLTLEPCRLSP